MTNYFYNLPDEIQDKIYFELHNIYMNEIFKHLRNNIVIKRIKRNRQWIDEYRQRLYGYEY
jgi:hypothetical protein|tara:strand:- start:1776 stop:1958 length:183 start_codon:yes stop_codon:yes gene_type:complete